MTILLADAQAPRCARLRRFLDAAGHPVASAAEGETAFEAFRRTRPDVVITDGESPPPGGLELCRRIRSIAPAERTYLILCSGTDDHDGRRHTLELGVDDFLVGTVREEDLRARLAVAAHVLRQRQAEARLWNRVVRIPTDCPFPILELSPEGDLLHSNPAAFVLLEGWGWTPGKATPAPLHSLAQSARTTGEDVQAELPCGDRTYAFHAVHLDDGGVTLYARDTTPSPVVGAAASPAPEAALPLARRDVLTGLPHHLQFVEHLHQGLDQARLAGDRLVLAKINIDNCREINEAFGPTGGDEVIRVVAHCLLENLRDGDAACREFGDQFIVLLRRPAADGDGLGNFHATLKRQVEDHARTAGLSTPVTLSVGAARFPEDAESPRLLAEYADLALAEAKRSGRDGWRVYASVVQATPWVRGGQVLPRLIKALLERRIEAHFQPIIRAADGRIAGFEALARWHEPEFGWVPPGQFIAMAEARGLIGELGRQVAALAVQQLARWHADGHAIQVALNISRQQLLDEAFLRELHHLVLTHRLEPRWVVLEATERQSLLQDPACRRNLEQLTRSGFRLSLDDFGTGQSSFDVIADLPLHEVKLPMDLVRKVRSDRVRRIVQAILDMSRTLELESVAEGIEDGELAGILGSIGATKLQGYHYSKPLTPEASREFLKTCGSRA